MEDATMLRSSIKMFIELKNVVFDLGGRNPLVRMAKT